MNFNNLINLNNDPVLPELIHEEPIYSELFQIDDLLMPTPHIEINDLNRKFELLTVDTNTHGLRIEVERAKRHRLQSTVKRMRQDLTLANTEILMLKNEITQFRDHQNSINFQLDNDHARTSTLAFRCLSRISQLISGLALRNAPMSEPDSEVDILLRELDLTIRQFGIYYQASYV